MSSSRPSAASLFGWSSLTLGVLAVLLFGAWPVLESELGLGSPAVDTPAGGAIVETGVVQDLQRVAALIGGGRLGELSTEATRLQRAEDLLVPLLEHRPELAEAHRLQGLLELARGEADDARRALERSLEIAPDQLLTLLALGATHAAEEDHAAAEEIFRRAVELYPSSAEAHDNLGQTLWLLGREEEALEAYQRKLEVRQMSADTAAGAGTEAGTGTEAGAGAASNAEGSGVNG